MGIRRCSIVWRVLLSFFFFFQAEDGIRDLTVTGVQTCALPISQTFGKPDYTRYLADVSIGGPLIKDRLFFFGSYEGNYQNRDALVRVDTGKIGRAHV